jgi:hypothetical protein
LASIRHFDTVHDAVARELYEYVAKRRPLRDRETARIEAFRINADPLAELLRRGSRAFIDGGDDVVAFAAVAGRDLATQKRAGKFAAQVFELFEIVGALRKLVELDERILPLVCRIYAAGKTPRNIADLLNQRGHNTMNWNLWTTDAVVALLRLNGLKCSPSNKGGSVRCTMLTRMKSLP